MSPELFEAKIHGEGGGEVGSLKTILCQWSEISDPVIGYITNYKKSCLVSCERHSRSTDGQKTGSMSGG